MRAIVAYLTAKPGLEDKFKEAMVAQAQRCLANEPGCLQFDVSQDPKNATRFAMLEVYKDDAAIKADNPDANLPNSTITPVHRSDDSGTPSPGPRARAGACLSAGPATIACGGLSPASPTIRAMPPPGLQTSTSGLAAAAAITPMPSVFWPAPGSGSSGAPGPTINPTIQSLTKQHRPSRLLSRVDTGCLMRPRQ